MPGRYYRQGEDINLDRDFPQIEGVTGVVEISPSVGGPQREVKTFTKSNLPVGYVYCNNPVCKNGGVPLGEILWNLLSQMVRDKQTEGRDSEFCRGYENMGRGRRRDCRTTFVTIKVQIKYKRSQTGKEQ